MASASPVEVRREPVVIPTCEPAWPDRNPMFLEKRVYQGSSGRVYPLPVTERIADKPEARTWEAVYVENEFVRVMILPALGGRIHRAVDKTNGYDFIYHQPVLKPALVGLTGPWASGGIEVNWPQHHRPSTYLPADVAVERHPDGAATVWLGEHDPMARMKGMHGVRLRPGSSAVEIVGRAYNRTADVQTFLWWTNIGVQVHEAYQSFFPPDVWEVADHARRATSRFPLCDSSYYGVEYGRRTREGIPATETPTRYLPASATDATGRPISYAPNDLRWYANIPVPTSYMCVGSRGDFVGGYDHRAGAGLIHVANHHVSPGKKQWTWGNHPFGYSWDGNLTDARDNGEHPPYIELMAGVYTDNQPDFSYLQPGETKKWTQVLYPIRAIGPACQASADAAVSVSLEKPSGVKRSKRRAAHVRVGVAVTARQPDATVLLESAGRELARWSVSLSPAQPFVEAAALRQAVKLEALSVRVIAADGRVLVSYDAAATVPAPKLSPATEPVPPEEVGSADELYVIGLHLEQYRHATRMPEAYWREALRRDPGDSRCNLALGRWHLRRGELDDAERHLRASIARLVSRNPNPYDGEAHYQLGLCMRQRALLSPGAARRGAPFDKLRPGETPPYTLAGERGAERKGRLGWGCDVPVAEDRAKNAAKTSRPHSHAADAMLEDAYAAFYKATWSHAWQAAAYHGLAEIDACRHDWTKARDHIDRSLRANADNLRARNLRAVVLRRLGHAEEADTYVAETLALDPLDWWARDLAGKPLDCDWQVRLDLALDYARCGEFAAALDALRDRVAAVGVKSAASTRAGQAPAPRLPDASLGTTPLVHYYRAWLCHCAGASAHRRQHLKAAAAADPDYCFPARLEEIAILQDALQANPNDGRAAFYLGNLLYDRRRHREAIALWETAVRHEPANAVAWRNLGIAYFNVLRRPAAARTAYERAIAACPDDARLLYERDQLWKRLRARPERRLAVLRKYSRLVAQRDDLSVELCALWTQLGKPEHALEILGSRLFHPWEGGEGKVLEQHMRACVALGKRALREKRGTHAAEYFSKALTPPENLGEAGHPLANTSEVYYWLGVAAEAAGDRPVANRHWRTAASFTRDFQSMSVTPLSEMSYYSALALQKLGRGRAAASLLTRLRTHARALARTPVTIDYFATSLPTMLLFDDEASRQRVAALFMEAQAELGLGRASRARNLLKTVLQEDPNHPLARSFLT